MNMMMEVAFQIRLSSNTGVYCVHHGIYLVSRLLEEGGAQGGVQGLDLGRLNIMVAASSQKVLKR